MSSQDPSTVTLPQGRVAYRDSGPSTSLRTGSGDPVMFLHGWPLSSRTWRKVIPALEPSHRCIAVDLLGAGDSEADTDADLSTPAQTRMLAAFLDALELPAVSLVAHDSGATIGRELAVENPQRITRFVLFDTEVPGHLIPSLVLLQRLLRLPGSTSLFGMLARSRTFFRSRLGFGRIAYDRSALDFDELYESIAGPLLRSRARVEAAKRFAVQFDQHFPETIPHDRLTMPKLVLWGDHDNFFPLAWGRELYEVLPEPKSFTVIADCGIFPHEERPAEWLAAVQPFLAGTLA